MNRKNKTNPIEGLFLKFGKLKTNKHLIYKLDCESCHKLIITGHISFHKLFAGT